MIPLPVSYAALKIFNPMAIDPFVMVENDGTISYWDASLGTQPTQAQIDAVMPQATMAAMKDEFTMAVQAYLDATARRKGYDDALSASRYAAITDTSTPFRLQCKTEGVEMLTLVTDCWAYCYQELAKVMAGARTVPSVPDFINELPKLNW